ncbi:hypothetical protein B0H19DRAFT_1070304 [Mycena capillaripes]|nr:hypothetical protein B0H19DRAFT_1070304 [Mycena capillaripes]
MAEYSHYKTLVPNLPRKAGAVNALLFFEAGDNQVLCIWDVRSGDCQQELNDASWGQINNLSSLDNVAGLSLFVGTGRGVVSVFPWNTRAKYIQFTDQSRTSFNVFELDVPVESQGVDPIGSRRCYDSDTGIQTVKPQQLRGTVGFVAFSPDERLKAVHDLNTDCYVLYNNACPTSPWHPSHQQEAREKSKEHPLREQLQRLEHPDDSTVCALATYSTQDFHFIASGEGETPAQILIWANPEKRIEAEEQQYQAQAAHETQAQARAAQEAATHRAEVAARAVKMDSVVALVKVFVGLMLLVMVLLFIPLIISGWIDLVGSGRPFILSGTDASRGTEFGRLVRRVFAGL